MALHSIAWHCIVLHCIVQLCSLNAVTNTHECEDTISGKIVVAELRSRKVRWWRCYVWFIWYDNEISRHHLKGGPSLKTQDKRIFGQCNVTLLTHKNVNYKVQNFLEASIGIGWNTRSILSNLSWLSFRWFRIDPPSCSQLSQHLQYYWSGLC